MSPPMALTPPGAIERVCDNLVVIDSGRLLRSDTISSFTSEMQVLAVEVDSKQGELVARLQSEGLRVTEEGRLLLVDLNGSKPYDQVRDAVAELGIGLLRLEQRRHSLEDLFREEAGGTRV